MQNGYIKCPKCGNEVDILKVKSNRYTCYIPTCNAVLKNDRETMKVINDYLKANFNQYGKPRKTAGTIPGVNIAPDPFKEKQKKEEGKPQASNKSFGNQQNAPKPQPVKEEPKVEASQKQFGNQNVDANPKTENQTSSSVGSTPAKEQVKAASDIKIDAEPVITVVNGKKVDLVSGEIIEDVPEELPSLEYDDEDYTKEPSMNTPKEDIDIYGSYDLEPSEEDLSEDDVEEPDFGFAEYDPTEDEPTGIDSISEDEDEPEYDDEVNELAEEVPMQMKDQAKQQVKEQKPQPKVETIEEKIARLEAENAMLKQQQATPANPSTSDLDLLSGVNTVADRSRRVVRQAPKPEPEEIIEDEDEVLDEIPEGYEDEDYSESQDVEDDYEEAEEFEEEDIEDELNEIEDVEEKPKARKVVSFKKPKKKEEPEGEPIAEEPKNKRVNFAKKTDSNDDSGRVVSKKVYNSNVDGYYNDRMSDYINEPDIIPKSTFLKVGGVVLALVVFTFYCIAVL